VQLMHHRISRKRTTGRRRTGNMAACRQWDSWRCTTVVHRCEIGRWQRLVQSARSSTVNPYSAISLWISRIACAFSATSSRSAAAKKALAPRISS